MSHILGVYWAPGHQRPTDIEYMQRLQPPAIRVLDPDPNQLVIAHNAAPNALVLPRDWSMSEQHDDVRRDPVGTGKRHAQEWRQKLDRWALPIPANQIVVVGMNELQVWTMLPQAVQYTVAMLDECTRLNLRACALNLSVGWPANTGPDTPPDWTPYAPIEAPIKRGNHFLTLHSYWYRSGPQDGAGWWAWRHRACPWDVPIIIGEAGVDLYVDMKRWENDGKPNRGWQGNISPDQYAAQMEEYARGCDRRVVAILPFLTDYRANIWQNFDTAPAHNALLARKDRMVPQAAPPTHLPFETHLPNIVSTGPTPSAPVAYVIAPAGLNLRAAPDGDILTAMPYGEQVQIVGVEQDGWLRVRYGRDEGYAAGIYISLQAPEPTPVVEPTPQPTDNFERCLRFVLKQEGGWADDPRDVGGATMKGVTIGTFTRWRQAHGQPVPSKDDLRNISDAELYQIYKEWYWDASGSGSLSWPLCLMHFNIAVNAGPERAKQFLTQSNGNFLVYVATAMEWYTRIDGWQHFGAAWTRRNAAVLREAAK